MLGNVLIVGGLVILISALIIIALLIWQATVRPYTFDELFVLPDETDLPMETPQGGPRIISLTGVTNLRDIGGYTNHESQRIKWREVFRSARLLNVTDEDIDALTDLGIRTVVDLRQSENIEEFPNRLPDEIDYHRLPVFEDVPMAPYKVVFNRHRLLDVFTGVYVDHIVERGAPTFGKLIKLISDEGKRPLLYHCTAGKDRTGVATMLIQRTLGVPRDVVIKDYLLTNKSSATFIEELDTQLGVRNVRGVNVEQLYPLIAASPKLINAALDHIDTHYGSVPGYLTQKAGLTPADLDRLRASLLT